MGDPRLNVKQKRIKAGSVLLPVYISNRSHPARQSIMQHAEQVQGNIWYPQFGHTVGGYGAPRARCGKTFMPSFPVVGIQYISVIANSATDS